MNSTASKFVSPMVNRLEYNSFADDFFHQKEHAKRAEEAQRPENANLRDIIQQFQAEYTERKEREEAKKVEEEETAREKLISLEKEKCELVLQLARTEAEKGHLEKKVRRRLIHIFRGAK